MARRAALLALVGLATWIAAPRPVRLAPFLVVLLTGWLLVLAGLALAHRVALIQPVRLTRLGRAFLLGAVAGAVVLGVLVYALVPLEPALATRLRERAAAPAWMPLALAVEASVLEEVACRLFLFSLVAWLLGRAWRGRRTAIDPRHAWIANGVAALAFAAIHLPAWAAVAPSALLITSVLGLNGAAGLFLGEVYRRWSIEAAIAAHFAADLVVQGAGPRLLT